MSDLLHSSLLPDWTSLPDGEFLSFDSILKSFFSSSDENVLSLQSGQHPSTVLAHSFSPSCTRLLPVFLCCSHRLTTMEKLVLMPSCVYSLTLCQFWPLLIKKKPVDREERKIELCRNFFATKKEKNVWGDFGKE